MHNEDTCKILYICVSIMPLKIPMGASLLEQFSKFLSFTHNNRIQFKKVSYEGITDFG